MSDDDEVERFKQRLTWLTREALSLATDTRDLARLLTDEHQGIDDDLHESGRRRFEALAAGATDFAGQLRTLETDPALTQYLAAAMSPPRTAGTATTRSMGAGGRVVGVQKTSGLAGRGTTDEAAASEDEAAASEDDWNPTKGTTSAR